MHRPTQRAGTSTITWAYDDDNRKVIAGSSQSTDTIFANLRGQPTKVVTVLAGQPYMQTYHYTAPGGLLDTLKASGLARDSFVTRSYGYDTQKGMLSSIGLRSQTTNLDYDNNENVTRITYPFTGVDSTIRGGLTDPNQHKTEAANNAVLERGMGMNAVGQIDRHLRHTQKRGWWFTYDSLGQLRQTQYRFRNPDAIPGGCPNYWGAR